MPAVLIIVFGVLIAVLVVGADIPVFGGVVPSEKVKSIAVAISRAEGFGVVGALPTRTHNPGDLKLGDLGNGLVNGKTVFASDVDGWNALYKQIQLMVSGGSSYYSPTDSWRVIAQTWVGTSDYINWLNTVTGELGVDPDSSLQEYMDA